jgi:hypothetical protein
MKKELEKSLKAKQQQRTINASRPVAEKFKTLDRLREASEQLKRATYASTGRSVRSGK